jgi:hypothetical protein
MKWGEAGFRKRQVLNRCYSFVEEEEKEKNAR